MRLLFVHADHLEFEAREPAGPDDLAETEGVPMAGRMEDCLTAFVAVESGDQADLEAVVDNAAAELRDVAGQLDTGRVVLYPYAHLSDDLAAPDAARTVMRDLEAALEGEFEVLRAPFGWYKSFEVACKGHPLAELSRQVGPEREAEAEEREPSEWYVATPAGDRLDPLEAEPDLAADMRALVAAEVEGEVAGAGEEPPHLRLMTEKALAGYDELSDVGNLRWYPRGKLVRDALMDYVDDLVLEYGGMPVETPVMYDLGARAISEHAGKFGERQYRFDSGGRRMMLRFAACFGQFSIMRDMHLSAADLPLRVYEMSTYSFRREQRGEVVGLKRGRAFTMPDMHTATADLEAATDEFERQALLAQGTAADLDLDYQAILRLTREFHDAHAGWVDDLVAALDRPVLLEVLPERTHYWSVKIDFAVIDALGRPLENPTVQLDVESAERFDIEYADADGTHHPYVLHYSPTGSIERVVCALLETAAAAETPRLPTWLSPTQVRFVPVGAEHVPHCEALLEELARADVRADVDDREESVGKRIARAETDWVPYYAVVGDREVSGEPLGVNVRAEGTEVEMTVEELVATVDAEVGDRPRPRRYLPAHLSDHPQFTGG